MGIESELNGNQMDFYVKGRHRGHQSLECSSNLAFTLHYKRLIYGLQFLTTSRREHIQAAIHIVLSKVIGMHWHAHARTQDVLQQNIALRAHAMHIQR